MARDIEIQLSTGYRRTLRQGTVWMAAGRIAEGEVYKPRDTVFSVEGTNVHEAPTSYCPTASSSASTYRLSEAMSPNLNRSIFLLNKDK